MALAIHGVRVISANGSPRRRLAEAFHRNRLSSGFHDGGGFVSRICSIVLSMVLAASAIASAKDIRDLSHHFEKPGGDIGPWMFIPADNIQELSTDEHRGLITLWEAGKGTDVKGVLADPIRIEDYPLPWQFQLGIMQAFDAM